MSHKESGLSATVCASVWLHLKNIKGTLILQLHCYIEKLQFGNILQVSLIFNKTLHIISFSAQRN